MDNVNCFGTESRLTSCSRISSVYNSYCDHSKDVAIYCSILLALILTLITTLILTLILALILTPTSTFQVVQVQFHLASLVIVYMKFNPTNVQQNGLLQHLLVSQANNTLGAGGY